MCTKHSHAIRDRLFIINVTVTSTFTLSNASCHHGYGLYIFSYKTILKKLRIFFLFSRCGRRNECISNIMKCNNHFASLSYLIWMYYIPTKFIVNSFLYRQLKDINTFTRVWIYEFRKVTF